MPWKEEAKVETAQDRKVKRHVVSRKDTAAKGLRVTTHLMVSDVIARMTSPQAQAVQDYRDAVITYLVDDDPDASPPTPPTIVVKMAKDLELV